MRNTINMFDLETVKEDYKTKNISQLAELYGCGKHLIKKFLLQNGLFCNKRHKKPNLNKDQMIGDLNIWQFNELQRRLDILQIEDRMCILYRQLELMK